MKITKRLFAVITAAVMASGIMTISASAKGIEETASNIKSGEKISVTIPGRYQSDSKIVLSKKGNITINYNFEICETLVYLYDADGNTILPNDMTSKTGKSNIRNNSYVWVNWNNTVEKASGTITYENISKGTYYLRVFDSYIKSGSGKCTYTVTFPSKDDENSGKISYLTLKMDKGDSIKLGAVVEPSDAEIKWTSSKTDIASVSASGKVTAKKVGKTLITAKSGSSAAKIMIIVEDDD